MDIIRNVLDTICGLANAYLQNIDHRAEGWVVLTSLVDHDGSINPAARDKVVMSVYNLTRETSISTYQPTQSAGQRHKAGDSLAVVSPPLYVDVHLMFMANFAERNYSDGLAMLSRVISYFQQNPVFTQANAPGLDPDIDKLTLDFDNLSPVDVNYVMSMLGTRYLPSAFYKLRMLPFTSLAMQARAYPVTGTALTGGNA